MFRVVTQIYGKGIVKYGSNQATVFNNTATVPNTPLNGGNGGNYNDICDAQGCIWLEVDLSCPVCADCNASSLDGYTGTTIASGGSATSFTAWYRRYANMEFILCCSCFRNKLFRNRKTIKFNTRAIFYD